MDERKVPTLESHEVDTIFGFCGSFIDLDHNERKNEPAMSRARTRLCLRRDEVHSRVKGAVERHREGQ